MCGIVGIVGSSDVSAKLIDGLKRLEYRGYDSAGIATVNEGQLERRRAEGKLVRLEEKLKEEPLPGKTGIGHTRWATHGKPELRNAHPHFSNGVAVVHNGIIENFSELRQLLTQDSCEFDSDTDTEVVAHLVAKGLSLGKTPEQAVKSAVAQLTGAFALVFIFENYDDLMIGVRQGPPLALAYGDGEIILGSDAIALAPFSDQIAYLDDGDIVVIHGQQVVIYDAQGAKVTRSVQQSQYQDFHVSKGNYRHFMLKEIHEQPEVIARSISDYVDFSTGRIRDEAVAIDFSQIDRLIISACGTAFYAGMIAKYWFEQIAHLPVDADIASEFRYREAPLSKNSLALFISQSGETADTLASLRYCRAQGVKIAAVVNVPTSTIARESDVVCQTLAGPEIGVASTKAFTCQLALLVALALVAAKQRGFLAPEKEHEYVKSLAELQRLTVQSLKTEKQIETIGRELAQTHNALYLGRGNLYPLALEGALKLKEISYIHAEGYAAGELKHGPIALIDEHMPVIVLAPSDRLFEKSVSNMQEVAARGGRIILITDEAGAQHIDIETMSTIILPEVSELITPLIYALPIQLLAYHTAVFMGTDVDQPRNLAKSVTVE